MSYITNSDRSDLIKKLSELGMVVGAGLVIEHKLSNGRWTDEDKEECHGKVGIALFFVSALVRLTIDPQGPQPTYS